MAAAEADAKVTLYIDENEMTDGTDTELLALRQNEADRAETTADDGDNVAVTPYTATDEDADTLDTNAQIRYKVEGADADHFTIDDETGVLGFASGDDKLGAEGADFEDTSSYSITIVATSGGTADTTGADPVPNRTVDDVDRTRHTTLAVTIMVVDQEDPGEVKISAPEPQEGKSVVATLSDKDGGVTGVSWQWSRRAALALDNFNDPDDDDSLPDPVKTCADIDDSATGVEWANIADATSPIYTPDSYTFDHDADDETAEVGYCLRATAEYTDNIANTTEDDDQAAGVDESKDMADETPTRAVQRDDPANTAPKFNDDQDLNTPGDQAVAERSVAENTEGVVGEAVVAADDDLLMYSVDDTDNFKVDNSGQISTAVELDYETQSEYMVTLTATDPSGASDTIMVRITVTDENDDAIIVLGTGPTPEPGDTCGMAPENSSLVADCRTLLGIMDDLVGDGPALNWSVDTSIEDDWQGVAAGTGRVAGIYLPDSGLAGTVPAGISDLDALTRLTLRDNDLTGGIPDLSALDNLDRLILSNNALTGEIPTTLGDMENLEYLYLQGNMLTGGIPAELSRAERLIRIWVHGNMLTGEIPSELGHLPRLRYLLAHNNMLTGEIPLDLGMASNMKALYLYNNMLTGSIPAELGNMVDADGESVRLLYLQNNMLSGEIPAELGNLVSLRTLRLSGNMLTGCIPAAIAGAAVDADAADLAACTN